MMFPKIETNRKLQWSSVVYFVAILVYMLGIHHAHHSAQPVTLHIVDKSLVLVLMRSVIRRIDSSSTVWCVLYTKHNTKIAAKCITPRFIVASDWFRVFSWAQLTEIDIRNSCMMFSKFGISCPRRPRRLDRWPPNLFDTNIHSSC